jgi:hypothetical protein
MDLSLSVVAEDAKKLQQSGLGLSGEAVIAASLLKVAEAIAHLADTLHYDLTGETADVVSTIGPALLNIAGALDGKGCHERKS